MKQQKLKHIKKVFLQIETVPTENIMQDAPIHIREYNNNQKTLTITPLDNGTNLVGFVHTDKIRKKNYLINLPIIPMLFYDNAYQHNRIAKRSKEKLFTVMDNLQEGHALPHHETYDFFGFASSSIIMMCVALETFANDIIAQKNFVFEEKNTQCTKIFNTYQTQREIDLKKKLFQIIPTATRNYPENKKEFCSKLHTLIDFRNLLVHLKADNDPKDMFESNTDILKRMLNFDYDGSLLEVRKYMNFFRKDYLQDCNCEHNY